MEHTVEIDIREELFEFTLDGITNDRAPERKYIIFGLVTAKMNGCIKGLDNVSRVWKLL